MPGKALVEMLQWSSERQIRINLMKGEKLAKSMLRSEQREEQHSVFGELPVMRTDWS